MTSWDWLIIGAGSSGCVLANRLSEYGRVLLVEAGPDLFENPGPFNSTRGARYDWGYHTPPQPGLLGRSSPEPHGRLVGGTSSINGVVYMRPDPADLDRWAKELGAPGWGYADLLPYFQRVENCVDDASADLGHGGPLWLEHRGGRADHPVIAAFHDAAVAAGHPPVPHFDSAGGCIGVAGLRTNRQLATGARIGAKEAYLDPIRSRVDVWADSEARRLIIERGRCVGAVVDRAATSTPVRAGGVVLCASTAETPRLLLASGIGPEAALRQHGIPLQARLDGVGANLHDHVLTISRLTPRRAIDPLRGIEVAAFYATETPPAGPELELMVLPSTGTGPGGVDEVLVISVLLTPRSRGRVSLDHGGPDRPPVIDPNFLAEPEDVARLSAAARHAAEVIRTGPLADWVDPSAHPEPDLDDAALEQWVRARAQTQNHMAGSARLGTDALAVVDPELRVPGVGRLWIADVSTQPQLVAAHAQATVFAVAERAAELIRTAS